MSNMNTQDARLEGSLKLLLAYLFYFFLVYFMSVYVLFQNLKERPPFSPPQILPFVLARLHLNIW